MSLSLHRVSFNQPMMWRTLILIILSAPLSLSQPMPNFASYKMAKCGKDKGIPPAFVRAKLTTKSLIHCAMECGRDFSTCENFDFYPGSPGQNCHIGSVTNTSNGYGKCNNLVNAVGSLSYYRRSNCTGGKVYDSTTAACRCPHGYTGVNCIARVTDCKDFNISGLHYQWVHPVSAPAPFKVKCYGQITFIFSRSFNTPLDFNRTYDEYAAGFGNLSTTFYLGNRNLHYITNTSAKTYHLMIQMYGFNFTMFYRYYFGVKFGSEADKFRISLTSSKAGQDTDANGDALLDVNQPQLSIRNMPFSTYDRDQDNFALGNCAQINGGGWWYNQCTGAPLTAKLMNSTQIAALGGYAMPGHADWATMPQVQRETGISTVNVAMFS